jgi:hypothetical protein
MTSYRAEASDSLLYAQGPAKPFCCSPGCPECDQTMVPPDTCEYGLPDCVCGEINSRNCPKHQGDFQTKREAAADAVAVEKCFCGADADDVSFDRSICACGSMHNYCNQCGAAHECPFDYPEADPVAEVVELPSGMRRSNTAGKTDYTLALDGPMFERYAKHLTAAVPSKGKRNWMNAQSEDDLERFREGFLRHAVQWLRGDDDEDHAAALFFNVTGAEYVKDQLSRS